MSFNYNLIRLISLVILWSHCLKVAFSENLIALPECTVPTEENVQCTSKTTAFTDDTYCKTSDGKIYNSESGTPSCTIDATNTSGYVLFDCNENKCVKLTNLSSDPTGNLLVYHCEYADNACTWTQNKVSYYLDSNKLYQCLGTAPCTPATGVFYLTSNNSNVGTTSKLVSVTSGTSTDLTITAESYYTDGSNPGSTAGTTTKLIYCSSETECESGKTVSAGIYINGNPDTSSDKITQALISCIGTSSTITCEVINGIDGKYYVNAKTNGLIKCVSNSGCADETDVITTGFYIDESSQDTESTETNKPYKKLITCSSPTDCSSTLASTYGNGYYINSASTDLAVDGLINCTNGDCIIAGVTVTVENHYLDAKTKQLITCTTTACILQDNTLKGYFLNSDTTGGKVIKCTGATTNSCVVVPDATAYANTNPVGSIKVDGNTVKLCLTANCKAATAVDGTDDIEIKADANGTDAYKSMTVTANGFPGVTENKKIAVKIGSNGIAVPLEETSLPECNSVTATAACTILSGTLVDGGHCINDNKIYKTDTTNNACTQLAEQASSTKEEGDKIILYFDVTLGYTEATINENAELLVYECTLDSSKKYNECDIVKGYTNDGTNYIQCNGWKGEKCVVTASISEGCTDTSNGILGTGDKVCFSATESQNVALPEDSTENKIAFNLTDTSSAYGALKDDIIFLLLSNKKAVVDSTSLGEGKRYFINYTGENTKQNQIVQCDSDNCRAVASNAGYYLDSGSETVISITTTKKRTKTSTTRTVTVVSTTYAKLISCPTEDNVCTTLPTPSPGFYVDASSAQTTTPSGGTGVVTTYSKLIKCIVEQDENNQDLPPACELVTSPKAGFYINAITTTDKFTESLIECTGEGTNVACQVKTLDTTKDKDSVFINSNTGKLIQCKDGNDGCQEFASTGTSTVPAFYVNGGKAGSSAPTTATEDYSDLLIRCTNEKCELANGGENNVYLNANLNGTTNGATQNEIINDSSGDSTNHLIICSEGSCVPSADSATTTNYYVNSGVDSDATESALIKCSSTGTPNCELIDVTLGTGVTEIFYINANTSKDAVHYLIKCTTNGCEPFTTTNVLAATDDVEYYAHGTPKTDDLTESIIACTLSEVTASRKRSTPETKQFTASCTFVAAPTANQIYINSFNRKLIQCYGTVCEAFSGVLGSASNPAYYVNAASTSTDYTDQLIKCSGSSCEIVDGIENAVYINGNFKDASITSNNPNPNGVTDKRLIICDKSTTTCEPAEVNSEITGISYFVNGNNIEAEGNQRRGISSLANAIIKCPATATPLQPCKTINGVKDGVYLNANFDQTNNPKQVIKCTSEGGCIEDAAYADGVTGLIYYVNAGSVENDKLTDTLIECTSSDAACAIKDDADSEQIYVNSLTNQLILCYSDKGCVGSITRATDDKNEFYLNSSDLQNDEEKLNNDLIKCSISISDDETKTKIKKCEPYTGGDKKVYVNSYNTSQLIYCLENVGCAVKNSNAIANRPEYYVNGDDIDFEEEEVDSDPLNGDLIECKKNDSGITCSVIKGHAGDVYINSNFNTTTVEGNPVGDDTNQLIKCSTDNGCVIAKVENDNEALPLYYINSGNKAKDKLIEALIKCVKAGEACEVLEAKANEVYVNSNENQLDKPIIKCIKNNCSAVISRATNNSKEYYINAGKVDDTPLQYDIIECSIPSDISLDKRADNNEITNISCECLGTEKINKGVYINSNYSETGDSNQLIQCSDDNGCVGVSSQSTSKIVEYYVNAESTDLNNAIIFCSNMKCEKQTPADINKYYVGKDGDNVNGLIECVKTIVTPKEELRKRATDDTVNKCTLKSAFTSQGYYLNNGYNKSVNQTIWCDSIDGCSTLKVDLGYYVNAGNSEKPIIKCEKVGSECVEEVSKSCSDPANAVPGNYCYENDQLKFFIANRSAAIAASKFEDFYTFATIPSNGFPGIKTEIGALFKISRYFINRFYQGGVVMIDRNGKLVDILGGDQSNVSLYDCNEITKVCTERPGCTPNTYMLDSENAKVIFCNNNGNLEYAQFTGYVVDGNRVTNGNKSPYIIYCEKGENCTSFKPKISTYYENSGYDSLSNNLIRCINSNCITITAEVGYYVGHGESGNAGIIKCSSPTSCKYSQVKNKVKFVNAGFDKRNNAIIECKNNGCAVAKAKSGYYLTHTSTLLIQCTSPTSCAEFTPTANYYDNADSSESSNTIINCVQNGNIVTCATEATNNGFYLSSLPNVLIRCRSYFKCKTITIKNGIFRGAVKGLTSKRRYLEDDDAVQNIDVLLDRKEMLVGKNFSNRDADEEDEKKGNLRDNNDDAYGVIRCVAGKCTALSASELAAIPICEFNNNKCYITLEYAMTKSATTSITAGSICTNSDRSVFYFATDTVVVKPNVISGVTSTYVYTTTNSNCLEVNESYSDMYFTIGSNIYTLDQGSVLQFYETGYYFINVAKNTLVGGNNINAYNDENVKLYSCNGSSCSIVDKPEVPTYYADVNKRIMKYNVDNEAYEFAYEKDIICIFANNKCTPNADLKNHEFCITYKGEIVLATTDIKNRETGECYLASSINNYIYGYSYSQHLYHMNQFEAQIIDQTGYYIVSRATNMTAVSRNYKTKNSNMVIYGCTHSSCRIYEPEENTYYYDAQAKNILKYKDGVWSSPSTSGYAYISVDPAHTYIYKFIKNGEEITIQDRANYGYYYTVDKEMYHCDQEEDNCTPVDDTDHYFTNTGEIYYCIHDSEELEPTECTKKLCVYKQYYYIDETYYRCETNSILVPVVSRYCSYEDNVVINFPLALTEEFPEEIKQAIDDIQKHNNSTAVIRSRNKNNLDSVSGIFTNCTYNVEETLSSFDLVCVNNYVTVDEETEDVKICSIDHLGYVDCIENEDNPGKCNISATYGLLKPSLFVIAIILIGTLVQYLL